MADAKKDGPGLVTKLSTIMGELGNVEKKGFNKAQNYRFVRESDVVAALVPLLAKNHILLHTSVTSHTIEPLYKTSSGAQMWLTTVTVDGTWIDGDTGETLPAATFVGYGADTGDKGVYKAMTGAEKYMLMKGFLISTGDDPEADEKVDKTAAAAEASAAPRVARSRTAGVQRGGRSGNATDAQVNEIARLARDLGLDAAGVAVICAATIGKGPQSEGQLREFISGLTGDEAGKIVAALAELTPEEKAEEVVHTESTDDGEDGTPMALSLV